MISSLNPNHLTTSSAFSSSIGKENTPSQNTPLQNEYKKNIYSSEVKAFNGVLPCNIDAYDCSLAGNFSVSRLAQTDVLTVISTKLRDPYKLMDLYEVDLSKVVSGMYRSVGSIQTSVGKCLGTGTLITADLLLIARHSIEGIDLNALHITFESFQPKGEAFNYQIQYVVESDPDLDYAILKLYGTPGKKHGYAPIGNTCPMTELALLHYPLGHSLQVSVHGFTQTHSQFNRLQTFHDSDYGSSGGVYIDPRGRLVAIHLGAELNQYSMNLCRYALSIQEIIDRQPNSILATLADSRFDQSKLYFSEKPLLYLDSFQREFILDEEGLPKKILTHYVNRQIREEYHNRRLDYPSVGGCKALDLDKNNEICLNKKNIDFVSRRFKSSFTKCVEVYKSLFDRVIEKTNIVSLDAETIHSVYDSVPLIAFKKSVESITPWKRGTSERTIVVWNIRQWKEDMDNEWDLHLSVVTDKTGRNVTKFHFTIRKNNNKAESGYAWYIIKGYNKDAILLPREDEGDVTLFKLSKVNKTKLDQTAKKLFDSCLTFIYT